MSALFNQASKFLYHLLDLIRRWFVPPLDQQSLEYTFHQLLYDKNYDEALKLALYHKNLDIDLVYKCKWRSSNITIQLIENVLPKIQDRLWVLNECVQTVPTSYQTCKFLIEFGLSLSIQDQANGPSLSKEEQEEMLQCRQKLIGYERSLTVYENILGDYNTLQQDFDHVFYEEFRRKPPLESCIEFANGGDLYAVDICLDYYTEDLEPHLLKILSNIPETISPNDYRNLLYRACRDHKISEYFIQRALEMEERTLLSSNAIQLLNLGIELGVKNLEEVRDDLSEFYRIVYDCFTESNIYLSYKEFERMSTNDKLNCTINTEAKYRLLAFALAKCDDLDVIKILDYIICLRKRDIKIHWAYCEQYL